MLSLAWYDNNIKDPALVCNSTERQLEGLKYIKVDDDNNSNGYSLSLFDMIVTQWFTTATGNTHSK